MNYRRARRETSTPDITPLIDVVFQLIIFLVVTTTFTSSPGIKVDLPQSKSVEYVDQKEQLSVLIRSDGSLLMKGEAVNRDQLAEKIRTQAQIDKSATLILNGDTEANLGLVVEIMDISKRNGINRIHIGAVPQSSSEDNE